MGDAHYLPQSASPEVSGGRARALAGESTGRYTHRVAIANSRLSSLDDEHVRFTWKILWGDG